jgi:hypothetical protein
MNKKLKDVKKEVLDTLAKPTSYVNVLHEPYSTKGMETFVLFDEAQVRALDLSVTVKDKVIVYEMVLPFDQRISRVSLKHVTTHSQDIQDMIDIHQALLARGKQDKKR